nr:hypothetical protein [uncultured Clostridium sp.]
MLEKILTKDERKKLLEREESLKCQWNEYIKDFYKQIAEEVISLETIKHIFENGGYDYCYKTENDINVCMNCKGFMLNGGYKGYGKRKDCFKSSRMQVNNSLRKLEEVFKLVPKSFEEYVMEIQNK